jgi:hypothetical protein
MSTTSNKTSQNGSGTLGIHFFYVTLILTGILIIVATRDWTKLQGFTDYLSVAATITSLVLGVLAIIYSFVSSNSTNDFLSSVESSAREMRSVGGELQSVLASGQKLQENASQKNEQLHALIESLRNTVDTLSKNTQEIAGEVAGLPNKIDEIRNELKEQTQKGGKTGSTPKISWTAQDIEQYIGWSSIIGLTAIRAIMIAKRTNKYCDLKKLFKTEHTDLSEYSVGFLMSASCTGLFDLEARKDDSIVSDPIRIKNPVQGLYEAVEKEWSSRLSANESDTIESITRYSKKTIESLVGEANDSPPTEQPI